MRQVRTLLRRTNVDLQKWEKSVMTQIDYRTIVFLMENLKC